MLIRFSERIFNPSRYTGLLVFKSKVSRSKQTLSEEVKTFCYSMNINNVITFWVVILILSRKFGSRTLVSFYALIKPVNLFQSDYHFF